MKNFLLILACLFFSISAYSQQELKIINNTGQTLDVFLLADGINCNNLCTQNLETQIFTINSGTTIFDNFNDFDNLTPPVLLTGGPSNICNVGPTTVGPCTGFLADAICQDPLWTQIGFSKPGQSGCCWGRVGETTCGFVNSFSDLFISASWNVISPSNIVVIFN